MVALYKNCSTIKTKLLTKLSQFWALKGSNTANVPMGEYTEYKF